MNLNPLKTKPERLFLFLALLFGGILVFLIPPYQAPDEINHYFRSYQILQGHLFSEKTPQGLGGRIPEDTLAVIAAFEDQPFHPEPRSSAAEILENLRKTVSEEPKRFAAFANTALYSPVNYFPQALGMGIAGLFSSNPLVRMYGGRAANLLLWAFLVFLSIKIAPVFKWLFFALALLPTSLFLAATCSGDPLTNALCFLAIALILRLVQDGFRPREPRILALAALSCVLALAKPFYLLILLFFFAIPRRKGGPFPRLLKSFLLVFLPGLILQTAWLALVKASYVPHRLDVVVSPDDQLQYLFQHPFSVLETVGRSLHQSLPFILASFVGVLGWLDTHLPPTLLWIAGGNLLIAAALDTKDDFRFSPKQKAAAATVFLLLTLTVCLTQYLHWNPVGAETIEGLQGRYFLAFSPLLFLCGYTRPPAVFRRPAAALPLFETLLVFATLVWTIAELGGRYYG